MGRKLNPNLRNITHKACYICGIVKVKSGFSINSNGLLSSYCLECARSKNKEYKKTVYGLCTFMFNKMKYRIRKEVKYKNLKLEFSKEEFFEYIKSSKQFKKYYKLWIRMGYSQAYIPSVDRLDVNKGYAFNNIQIVNQRENSSRTKNNKSKTKLCKYVGVSWDSERSCYRARIYIKNKSKLIGRFRTQREAAAAINDKCKQLGIPVKNIGII